MINLLGFRCRSDDDDTAELLRELEKIKKERKEEQDRKVTTHRRSIVWRFGRFLSALITPHWKVLRS